MISVLKEATRNNLNRFVLRCLVRPLVPKLQLGNGIPEASASSACE